MISQFVVSVIIVGDIVVKKLKLDYRWKLPKVKLPKLKGGVTTADRNRWKRELGNPAKIGQGGKRPYLRIK